MSEASTPVAREAVGRDRASTLRDAVVLAGIAAALRLIAIDRLGIDHYDEGAFAMTAAAVADFVWLPDVYPLQHYLSPPLFFLLAAFGMRVFGSPDVLFGISIAAGAGTVAIVYLAGRRWFGRAPAGVAALAVALSDFHILYSRTGLTDVLFAGLVVLAVVLFERAEAQGSALTALAAGCATGLAWNTKYHGWLAGVVAICAVLHQRLQRQERAEWRGTVSRLAIAAAAATLMYVPWVLYVESQPGGYAALVAEHARFLVPAGYVQNGLTHLRSQLYLEGWTSRLAPLALVGWVALVSPDARRTDSIWIALLLLVASLALGAVLVLGLLAIASVVLLLRYRPSWSPAHSYPVAFFAVFTVLTPVYRPYPRLLLPWFIAAALVAGIAVHALLVSGLPTRARRPLLGLAALLTVVLAIVGVTPDGQPWRPRDGLRRAASELNRIAAQPDPVVVIGEPGAVFYLRREGREAWHADQPGDAQRYARAGRGYYLVGGIYSRRVRGSESLADWLALNPEAVLVGTAPVIDVSDVRLLDDFRSDGARRFRLERTGDYDLRVYHVGPLEQAYR